MKSHPVPKVGDIVVLNDCGLKSIYGTTLGLAHMKTLKMRVISVDCESMTEPEQTFCVEVDNEEISAFMIDHWDFDIVESATVTSGPKYERWGTSDGRNGIQRTLDPRNAEDLNFLTNGIRILDECGLPRELTMEEAEQMGIRRVVSAVDIHTGKMKSCDDFVPMMVMPVNYGETW